MKAFIFPGQGSQSVGMGRELYEAFSCAREVFEEVDETLGQNLTKIMFEGPEDQLVLTENAQPAIMAVGMAVMRTLEKEGKFDLAKEVSYVAGHSLGEYSALCAAKAFTLAETAKLLKTRGKAMQEAVPVGEGAMAAILGLSMADILEVADQASQGQICVMANDNSEGQAVLSGHKAAVERAVDIATEKGAKRSILLNVSAPFHCPLMHAAAEAMAGALDRVVIQEPVVPVISNVAAAPVQDAHEVKRLLVEQVTGQVRWRESVMKMAALGVTHLVEVGSGKVLTGLTRRIEKNLKGIALNTPQDIEDFLNSKERRRHDVRTAG